MLRQVPTDQQVLRKRLKAGYMENRNRFPTGQQTPDGQPIWTRLVYADETKIRRHVKIRQDANPFDPQWKAYFTDRTFQKKYGIPRQQAGIKSVVKPAPPRGAL